jgi:hypothetical protein
VGEIYTLQAATNLSGAEWQTVLQYPQTNGVMQVDLPAGPMPVFYRLKQE